MNEIEQLLYRTRNTVLDARQELNLTVEDVELLNIEPCSSCSIWLKPKELKPDQDGLPICRDCLRWYGF